MYGGDCDVVIAVCGFGFEAFTAFRSAAQSLVEKLYYRTLQIETGEKEGGVEERGHLPSE